MKTRIQLAGVAHGSKDGTVFNGDLPLLSGFPGMRFVINAEKDGQSTSYAFQFKQMCLEINGNNGEYEQVIYVAKVDKTQQIELVG
jgi:hypothetical protein